MSQFAMAQETRAEHSAFVEHAAQDGGAFPQPFRHSEMLICGQQVESFWHAALQLIPDPPPPPPVPGLVHAPLLQVPDQVQVPAELEQDPLALVVPLRLPLQLSEPSPKLMLLPLTVPL